ncbi:hypothetical protein CSOJ01_06143 [Colletotrichum sojae]|uniref:Uncharacterized protein n=1 Tax=Colletotrichum sojae TaxID=2175907 RepID=A0A8H6JCQ3_9PEZI|nr:hypothetical protein CSOJ01_06143 [Colletotrichum sojae]
MDTSFPSIFADIVIGIDVLSIRTYLDQTVDTIAKAVPGIEPRDRNVKIIENSMKVEKTHGLAQLITHLVLSRIGLPIVSRRGVVSPDAAGEPRQNPDPLHPHVPERRPHGISVQGDFRPGHKRSRSRDSSIIANPRGNPAGLSQKPTRHHESDVEQPQYFDEPKSSRAVQPQSKASPRFEKRARRRTRKDHYDSEKQPRQKPRKETTDRPGRPPKKSLTSAQEVMDKFHPGSILQERITVIANTPRREEMRRSRAKERQRRTREADEMLEYFGNGEPPLTTLTGASCDQPCGDYENTNPNYQMGPDCFDCWHETKQLSPNEAERDQGSLKREKRQRQRKPGSKAASHHRPSSRATSYMTWSTSNNQPSTKHELLDRDPSSTPEPVREALRQTGIFDGTGLLGKDRLSQTGTLPSDGSRGHAEDASVRTSQGERRTSNSRHDAARRTEIIRYQDKVS